MTEKTSVTEIFATTPSWLLPVAVAMGAIFALAILRKLLGGAKSVLLTPNRSNVLLIGLCGSGKTMMFSGLCRSADDETHMKVRTQTSIAPNRAIMPCDGKTVVVDFPGHQRLRHELFGEISQAKKLIVVIDSVTIHDDKTEGAKELAGLILATLQSHAFDGVSSVLFACTKRDEVTSYSSKAVRRILEAEMTRAIVAQGGAIGSLRGDVAKNVRKDARAKLSAVKEECMLILDENNKFSFKSLQIPFAFVDCSKEDLKAVEEFCLGN